MALYYALVSEVDHWIGRLLDTLDRTGLASNTLLVFTADHGELMGEHRTFSKCMFFEGCLRVPLLMRLPGVIPEGIVADTAQPAESIWRRPFSTLRGYRPWTSSRAGRYVRRPAVRRPSAPMPWPNWARIGAYARRHWKYFTVGMRGARDEYLFDLQADPDETVNLASADESAPAALSRLRATRGVRSDRGGGPYW